LTPPSSAAPTQSLTPPFVQAPAESSHPSAVVGYTGLALAVAGLATMGVGIYYFAVDGNPADGQPDYMRATKKYFLPDALVGGALLAAGCGLLLWNYWPRHSSLSLSPSGLQLKGNF
jgi:hypothetical protein